jgi:hypothetical protein
MTAEAVLYRDISLVTFGNTTIDEVAAVGILEGGDEISSTADDATEEQLVDVVNLTTGCTVYTRSAAWLGYLDQGAATRTLTVHVNSAVPGGTGKIYTFSNARFMGDSGNIKHADLDANCVLTFECQSVADADPLAVTDNVS